MSHQEELIKQAISAWVDGEATPEETELAERSVRENAVYARYAAELRKLTSSLKHWEAEDLSPDFRQRLQNLSEREGFSMKNLFSHFNVRLAGGLVAAALAVVVVVHFPEVMQKEQREKEILLQKQQTAQAVAGPQKAAERSQPIVADTAMLAERSADSLSVGSKNVVSGYAERSELRAKEMFRTAAPAASRLAPGGMTWDQRYIPTQPGNTEGYNKVEESSFKNVISDPLSTFSIDVDTASYSNLRRFLNEGQMPPQDALRLEEMINYFHYDYPKPDGNEPFSITTETGPCLWNPAHQTVLIGLKGKELDTATLPPSNLVFLIDVSGSMQDPNKLPLLQKAFTKLTNQLSGKEKVAIVTYAGNAGLVLASTPGSEKSKILQAIENLQAGGSTAGGQGIQLAYQVAMENFIKGGNNRVILATDGDFNVGASSDAEMVRLIEAKRDQGIFLTVLGFGEGNIKDSKMQQIADKGNGNYFYIDSLMEAQKVLVKELGSTLFVIAKDVKIQVEFNPAQVKSYRLVGYEKRALANEDFNNDKKDAGELGAGHTVTALYEIVPAGSKEETASVDPLKYQQTEVQKSGELLTVKLRYKEPDGDQSKLITKPLQVLQTFVAVQSTENFLQASAVAEFGLLLRKSQFKDKASYQQVLDTLKGLKSEDKDSYRQELMGLVEKAKALDESAVQGIAFKS
ncbi:MAG TPA: VWA domain-containing protein [Candidatus Omnitrophota bacterium]|nr:VWA domain-containing protein [Candidatus Omnitrophota bacterium]HPS36340.1 VWA domain-containing protein [Candidatus Omnitrophota bacterium]